MGKITLGYWNFRGLAEPIRYLLYYRNVKFEDKRYHFDGTWEKEKFTLDLDFPNLPYYIDENVKLTQSLTILRYLAGKYNLDGKTEAEKLRVSLIEQQINDFRTNLFRLCFDKDFENKKEEFLQKVPDQLNLLVSFLGDTKFLGGDSVTYVDFIAYDAFDFYCILSKTILDGFPALKAYQERIRNLPGFRECINSPSYVRWPIVGRIATWGGKGEEPK